MARHEGRLSYQHCAEKHLHRCLAGLDSDTQTASALALMTLSALNTRSTARQRGEELGLGTSGEGQADAARHFDAAGGIEGSSLGMREGRVLSRRASAEPSAARQSVALGALADHRPAVKSHAENETGLSATIADRQAGALMRVDRRALTPHFGFHSHAIRRNASGKQSFNASRFRALASDQKRRTEGGVLGV